MQHAQTLPATVPVNLQCPDRAGSTACESTGESAVCATKKTQISARAFRDALGRYASGVTVVTGSDEHGKLAFTCQSFYSVSTDPPLISFSVQKTSTTYPRMRQAGSFAINVLSRDQQHVSDQFARTGTDKWAGIRWSTTQAGNPVLENTLMWLDCQLWAEYDAGDHFIVLGRVQEISLLDGRPDDPLLYFEGSYRHLSARIAA